jgi:toxin YoeB
VKVVFSAHGWTTYLHWSNTDPTLHRRINDLIEDARRHPFQGIGKPEALKGDLAGWWSRRINTEHRLVYRCAGRGDEQHLEIAACRYRY